MHDEIIRKAYEASEGDLSELFKVLLQVADEIGLDSALKHLEACVIKKRMSWLKNNMEPLDPSENIIDHAYRTFFEKYLGLSIPRDGEIVKRSENMIVMRWWNECPALEACKRFHLDTRVVCRKAYHQPVEVFMAGIDPRLSFDRDYDKIRPYASNCEETIFVVDTR